MAILSPLLPFSCSPPQGLCRLLGAEPLPRPRQPGVPGVPGGHGDPVPGLPLAAVSTLPTQGRGVQDTAVNEPCFAKFHKPREGPFQGIVKS